MTLQEVINAANVLADESIDNDEMVTFVNRAISKMNMELGSFLPIADTSLNNEIGSLDDEYHVMEPLVVAAAGTSLTAEEKKRNNQLKSVNQMFLDACIIQYVQYAIKVQDGSQYEWTDSFKEWDKNMRSFMSRYFKFLNDDYKGSDFVFADGETNEYGLSVIPFGTDSPVNSVNTWGIKPTAGNGSVSGVRVVDSDNVYGIK